MIDKFKKKKTWITNKSCMSTKYQYGSTCIEVMQYDSDDIGSCLIPIDGINLYIYY